MKVTGFQVEEHGSGYALTIRVSVGREELADDWVGNLFARLRAGGDLFGHEEDEEHEDTQAGGGDEGGTSGTPDEKPASARGRRRGRRDAVGGAGDAPAEGEVESHDAPDADADAAPKGRRGRRSRPATEAAAAPAEPVKAGRRRGKKQEEKEPANPTEPVATAGRRSRKTTRRPAAAGTAKSPSKDDVSDEDLTKAASQAAASIGAPAVVDVLDEFEVAEVRDLNQAQRREFVAKLADA